MWTRPVNTAREHNMWTRAVCIEPKRALAERVVAYMWGVGAPARRVGSQLPLNLTPGRTTYVTNLQNTGRSKNGKSVQKMLENLWEVAKILGNGSCDGNWCILNLPSGNTVAMKLDAAVLQTVASVSLTCRESWRCLWTRTVHMAT